MKKAFLKLCVMASVVAVFLAGCAGRLEAEPETTTPEETKSVTYDILPEMNSFSGTEYEDYAYHFPPITAAVLHYNGNTEEIPVDDTRLIRLLNFIAYSYVSGFCGWRQSVVEDGEIREYLESDVPMLEVWFDNSQATGDGYTIEETPRIIISEDTYLIFADPQFYYIPGMQGDYAEMMFPYYSQLCELHDQGLVDAVSCGEEWGREGWIDMLEYAGFITN